MVGKYPPCVGQKLITPAIVNRQYYLQSPCFSSRTQRTQFYLFISPFLHMLYLILPHYAITLTGFVWKCWVNIPNEIAIFHRDNDQQNHWVQWGTLLTHGISPSWVPPVPPGPTVALQHSATAAIHHGRGYFQRREKRHRPHGPGLEEQRSGDARMCVCVYPS